MTETTAIRRKRLRHRSRYRGFLESDLLLARFVDVSLETLDDRQLDELEALLDEPDGDLWAWVTGSAPVPARHDNEIFAMLRAARGS